MKKTNLLMAFVLAAMIIISGSCSRQAETVRLGAIIGLTGSLAVYGESQKNGIELAVSEINSSEYLGKNKQLTVEVVDTGTTPDSAIIAIDSLIHNSRVSGIIGPTLSSQAFAADPLAQKAGIPVIGISNTAPGITEMGDYIFRCSLPESQVVTNTMETCVMEYGLKRVGIIWGNDDTFTMSSYEAFLNAVERNKLIITADSTFIRGEHDFDARLSEIIATNPDAIIASAFIQEAILIVKQARSHGFNGLIIGGNGFNSSDLITQTGESAEGIVVGTAWNIDSSGKKNKDLITSYNKAYGKDPDQFAAQSYTAVWLFAESIRVAGNALPESVRNQLHQIQNFESPLGDFSFTTNREPIHPSIVQIVRNGRFEIINR